MNTKRTDQRGRNYVSPSLDLIELNIENVICQDSGTFTLPSWQYDGTDDDLDW